jgi:hypothetical protein
MKHLIVTLSVAMATVIAPASAQDRGSAPMRSSEVLTQQVVAAPENGNIIVRFGETTEVYFKRAIKTVRLDDDMLVRAIPKSDHVIAFTGVFPGRSSVVVETTNGSSQTFGLVTVVREPHDVKIYQSGKINQVTGERRSDSSSAIGGYVMLSCNEIGCSEREPELQAKMPK